MNLAYTNAIHPRLPLCLVEGLSLQGLDCQYVELGTVGWSARPFVLEPCDAGWIAHLLDWPDQLTSLKYPMLK